jgi:NAD(P)-dependent dehydrogenase (short-subunit alcohol dehydrogenase family)
VVSCIALGDGQPGDGASVQHLAAPDHPWRAGLIGIVKTVAVEWPEVISKCLALDASSPERDSERILDDLAGPREQREVYRNGNVRLIPDPVVAPLRENKSPLEVRSDDVIVVIGGARGITSEAAIEMALRHQPTIVLLGRSAWPEGESSPTAGLESEKDLKRALFEQMQSQGKEPSPGDLERATRRVLMDREMRSSRAAMEGAGSRVFYHQADSRDPESMERVFADIYQTHGRVDGVIHGAGVIEDKLIEDKSPESFARVFDTKSRSVFNLARSLRPAGLKFLVIFSSIAGWTGNRGQVDYVAANEVLNRMALHLAARWKKRVVAIDWGPWAKSGMVTEGVRRQFLERGVGLVSVDSGRRFLLDEIRHGEISHAIVAALGKVPTPAAGVE